MVNFASNWWGGGPTDVDRWCHLAVPVAVVIAAEVGAAFGTVIVVAVIAAVIVAVAVTVVMVVVIAQLAMTGRRHLEGRRGEADVVPQYEKATWTTIQDQKHFWRGGANIVGAGPLLAEGLQG
ncbi:hypothetical protein V491_01105, partial [Pseudogymnoascus sp. VKM F-3775]